MTLDFVQTFDELASVVPVAIDNPIAPRIVLASITVETGDGSLVDLDGFIHVTNDTGRNLAFVPYIVRALTREEAEQVKVTKPAGQNLTPEVHHGRYVVRGIDQPPAGTWRYNLVAYACGKKAKRGDVVTVENKVWLAAKVFAP